MWREPSAPLIQKWSGETPEMVPGSIAYTFAWSRGVHTSFPMCVSARGIVHAASDRDRGAADAPRLVGCPAGAGA